MLSLFGAVPINRRVVIDRNRITGGGVTAGIDFALSVIHRLHGEAEAKSIQLQLEYNPEPAYSNGGGTPETAITEILHITNEKLIKRKMIERQNHVKSIVFHSYPWLQDVSHD
jgi:cyclohexyl-isocyanide hydratase